MFWSWISKLFPRITKYIFEPDVLISMHDLAWQTHPKEMIALLRGKHKGNTLVINGLLYQPFENTSYSATIHWDPTLTDIVGTYHSHPGSSPRPSRQDLQMFAMHPGVHGILAEPYKELFVYDGHGRLLGRHQIDFSEEK